MARKAFRCEAVPGVDRRSLLLGLAGAAALAPAMAAPGGATLGDLVTAQGEASPLARSLAGTTLSLRGYLAPSLDGRDFPLTETEAAPCGLCGALHDAGRGLTVRTERPDAPVLRLVEVTGRLALDGAAGVRLDAASIRAI